MKHKHSKPINQNFLHNKQLVEQLLDYSNISSSDLVIEIGGGSGMLTDGLIKRCGEIIVFENDPRWYRHLVNKYRNCPNVQVLPTDFLTYPLPKQPLKVLASIPYDQTAAIIQKLTDGSSLQDAYLIMQKEAALKYTGLPHRSETLRSLLLKAEYHPEILYSLDRTDFRPVPAVDSVLWHIRHRPQPIDQSLYRDFITSVFLARGQSIKTRLSHVLSFAQIKRLGQQLGFLPGESWTELNAHQWLRLFQWFEAHRSDRHKTITGDFERLRSKQARLDKRHRSKTRR